MKKMQVRQLLALVSLVVSAIGVKSLANETGMATRNESSSIKSYTCVAEPSVIVPQAFGDGPPKFYVLRTDVNAEKSCAQLLIPLEGHVRLEKIIVGLRCEPVIGLSRTKVRASFGKPQISIRGTDTFQLVGWSGINWNCFRVVISYNRDTCSKYRVSGPGIAAGSE